MNTDAVGQGSGEAPGRKPLKALKPLRALGQEKKRKPPIAPKNTDAVGQGAERRREENH